MTSTVVETAPRECAQCSSVVATCYEMRAPGGGTERRCLKHALLYRPMLGRSSIIAGLVGTLLTVINHGNVILGGDFPASLYWKIPLTDSVPLAVATTGAVLNARSSRPAAAEVP